MNIPKNSYVVLRNIIRDPPLSLRIFLEYSSDNPIVLLRDHDEHEDAQHEIHDDEESIGNGFIGSFYYLSGISGQYTGILGSYGGLIFRHGGNICNGIVFVYL